jgi:hypothetical protein
MKPDGKLPRHLQLMESLTSVAGVLMGLLIAGFAKHVKQLRDLRVDDPVVPELIDQFALGFVCFDSNTGVGSRVLDQEFTTLAQLDQCRVGVIKDIAFGECGVADEHLVVVHKEREVRRNERIVSQA